MSRQSAAELLAAARFRLRPLHDLAGRRAQTTGLTWNVRLGPETVDGHSVIMRSPRRDDGERWRELRLRDRARIEPWWATSDLSWEERHTPAAWIVHHLATRRAARTGRALPLVLEIDGQLSGECRLDRAWPTSGTAEMGAWVADGVSARLTRAALAMVLDHGFGALGLRRVSAPVCVDNRGAALSVLRVGFRREAVMVDYLHVGGRRADHGLYALTADRVPAGGMLAALGSADLEPPVTRDPRRPITRVTVRSGGPHDVPPDCSRTDRRGTVPPASLTESGPAGVMDRSDVRRRARARDRR